MEEEIKTVLRAVWDKVNWRRVARGRSPYDVFCHRVKAAAYQPTIPRFLEKLCHSLSLQSVRVDPDVIRRLDERRDEVLRALRTETIYYVLIATEKNEEGGE